MPPTRRDAPLSASSADRPLASGATAQPDVGSRLRSIQTPVLEIGYEEHGEPDGTAIILLHGFPYDVRSFDGCIAPLTAAGHRVLVPYLRGYGPTRFRDPSVPRMAEQAALAQDVIDFADALGLERFATAGFDWGNRAACIASILHPERVIGQVSIGGYSVQNTVTPTDPMPARPAASRWHVWYLNSAAGARALEVNRHDLIRYLWETWSPQWHYSDEDYARSAPSFDNPDFVEVVVHSYRHRQLNAPGEARFEEAERRLAERPPIEVRAIVLTPGATGIESPPAGPRQLQEQFTQLLAHHVVEGAGHDLPAHRPDAVADALMQILS